jgi:hypothetical protein
VLVWKCECISTISGYLIPVRVYVVALQAGGAPSPVSRGKRGWGCVVSPGYPTPLASHSPYAPSGHCRDVYAPDAAVDAPAFTVTAAAAAAAQVTAVAAAAAAAIERGGHSKVGVVTHPRVPHCELTSPVWKHPEFTSDNA